MHRNLKIWMIAGLMMLSLLTACTTATTSTPLSPATRTPAPADTPTAAPSYTPQPTPSTLPTPVPTGAITIRSVKATSRQMLVHGTTTLPDDTCITTELWTDGIPVPWWPTDACATVKNGAWKLQVSLDEGEPLRPGLQYFVRAYLPGGADVVSNFPFNLDAPPSPPSPAPGDGDPLLVLPESAAPVHRASVDLNGDGAPEEIVLTGWGGTPDRLGYDVLQMFVIAQREPGVYLVVWQSERLPTDRAEPLRVQDVNGDDLPEVLSVQAMGAGGETLYLLGQREQGYGWLKPQGGHFDGEDAFGETGVRLEDVDGDDRPDILASYGPASAQTDIYAWDGQAYVYRETLR